LRIDRLIDLAEKVEKFFDWLQKIMDFFGVVIAALLAALLTLFIVVVVSCIYGFIGFGATYFIVFLLIFFGLALSDCDFGKKKNCCRRKRCCDKE